MNEASSVNHDDNNTDVCLIDMSHLRACGESTLYYYNRERQICCERRNNKSRKANLLITDHERYNANRRNYLSRRPKIVCVKTARAIKRNASIEARA